MRVPVAVQTTLDRSRVEDGYVYCYRNITERKNFLRTTINEATNDLLGTNRDRERNVQRGDLRTFIFNANSLLWAESIRFRESKSELLFRFLYVDLIRSTFTSESESFFCIYL